MLFIDEEADTFASKMKIEPNFKRCINWGRMEGLGVVSISPRPANLHNDCIAQANHVFIFQTQLPNDLNWLSQFIPKEALEQLPKLTSYPEGNSDFLYWNRKEWRICKPVGYVGGEVDANNPATQEKPLDSAESDSSSSASSP